MRAPRHAVISINCNRPQNFRKQSTDSFSENFSSDPFQGNRQKEGQEPNNLLFGFFLHLSNDFQECQIKSFEK